MKTVKIKKMALHYFKGVQSREIEFGDGTNIISGRNGSGKSTIMDAFFWALWGKNSLGQSDTKFQIKTVDANGEEIPNVNHQVELVLEVDGQEQNFTRTLVPEYDKSGSLKGNHTEYFWNDVPMKKSEYDCKVREVVSEEVFSLVTSTTAFLSLEWKKQRELLMSIGGKVTEQEVAHAMESDCSELVRIIESGKNMDEYKRELDAKLKRVNDAMRDIPARIDEVQRSMPEYPNLEEIKEKRNELEVKMESIEKSERDMASAMEDANRKRMEVQKAINDAEFKMQQVLNVEQAKDRNRINDANQTYIKADAEMRTIKAEHEADCNNVMSRIKSLETEIAYLKRERKRKEDDLEDLRKKWKDETTMTFNADDYLKCPLYGHVCDDANAKASYDQNQNAAFAKWNDRHENSLNEIKERGKEMKVSLEANIERIEGLCRDLKTIREEYEGRKDKRTEMVLNLQRVMDENPKRPLISSIKAEDLPECMKIAADIDLLKKKKATIEEVAVADNREAKWVIRKELEVLATKESLVDRIKESENRVEELRRQLESLGSQKTDIEAERMLLNEFEITKCNLITDRINDMFKLVKWQMFQRQVNGEEIPACICLCDGVRYNDANTAARLNAGIDIASTLSDAYEVKAPMFIDNAECSGIIDKAPNNGCQRILLKYTEGDILVM